MLSGIYRTSYFVLDSVRSDARGDYYRLVDGIGGTQVMYMELRFVSDSLYFNAYTSRLGEFDMATRHMTFAAKKENLHLSQDAASAVGFPVNTPAWNFSAGFNKNDLYVAPGADSAKSASFLSEHSSNDVFTLAGLSGDPYIITDIPRLGYLKVDIQKNATIQNDNILLYLSDKPLTDSQGFFQMQNFNSITQFPDFDATVSEFLFTYLHPGDYYVTVVADHDGDGSPGMGDYTHAQMQVTVAPGQQAQVTVTNINVLN
ncbi:hypothetical protein KFE98_17440 [bacterium SCSIO 12741]|nr:hypothetical protein KFE98_17440 [bacterium SCSIO 12741]